MMVKGVFANPDAAKYWLTEYDVDTMYTPWVIGTDDTYDGCMYPTPLDMWVCYLEKNPSSKWSIVPFNVKGE